MNLVNQYFSMLKKTGLCLTFLFVIYPVLTGQVLKPYLQSPSDSSVWITWKTGSGTESKVLYGNDSLTLVNQVTGNCEVLTDTGYTGNYFYHSVRLTGLQPARFYYYQVITGSLHSDICRFRTQPEVGQDPAVYRILVLGDHQIKGDDRYERLMRAARGNVVEKYGGTFEEQINLIVNDGDQVDQGTLDQYENVHFGPSAVLSGNVAIMTTVGNHEFYGTSGIEAYYKHFFYDDLSYHGIVSPGGENYYSYQEGNIAFIHLSSEHPTDEQIEWVQQIVDSVKTDHSVKWLVSIAHRPIQAEQFVGDISDYVRTRIIPVLAQTEKSTLFIAGHHHLYARGQVRDFPMYHIISGAASWDQFWGQSVEKDFDDVQKTIDYWAYQIVTFDNAKGSMTVDSYAIGSPKLGLTLNNKLIDSFYRKPSVARPSKPSIITVPTDTITLPYIFTGSPYASASSELLNSTQFQIARDTIFSAPLADLIRDYENLFGTTGSPDYLPVDINKDVNILQYAIGKDKLPNGAYFIRTRHRDRNISWSEWSACVRFVIKGSVTGFTRISSPKRVYKPNESIAVDYEFGPGNARDWIGMYKFGDTPGSTPSADWEYVNGSSGRITLQVAVSGKYFIAFFENDGYTEIAGRIEVYVGDIPVLSLNKAGYAPGEGIQVSYSNAPGLPDDWLGIYNLDDNPGAVGSVKWQYTTGKSGVIAFTGLPSGYYFVSYFLENEYTEASERITFPVGTDLARVAVDQSVYQAGQPINIRFDDGPGTPLDWIGLFRQNSLPGTPSLVDRQFIENRRSGNVVFNLMLDTGDYYAGMFFNNTSIRISGKVPFTVEAGSYTDNPATISGDIQIYPSPAAGRIRITTSIALSKELTMRILSMTGEALFIMQFPASFNGHSEEIDLSGLPAGIYIACFRSDNLVRTKKIILK